MPHIKRKHLVHLTQSIRRPYCTQSSETYVEARAMVARTEGMQNRTRRGSSDKKKEPRLLWGSFTIATPFLVPRSCISNATETVATIHGSITTRPERHRGLNSTLRTNGGMHFTYTTKRAGAPLLGPPGLAAGWTPLGLVCIALGSKELLFTNRKRESRFALHAIEGFIS